MKILIGTPIDKNFKEVFTLFNENLFKALKPPFVGLNVERFDGCKKGDEVHLRISTLPFKTDRWVSHITNFHEDNDQIYFVDIGVVIPYPLKSWKHVHRIERISEHKCIVIDDIEFSSGNHLIDRLIYPALYAMFKARTPVYKRELS